MGADNQKPLQADSAAYLRYADRSPVLDSLDEVIEMETELDPITTLKLGLPIGTRARSKGWPLTPDPWVIKLNNSETVASASGLRFSVVEIQTVPVRTYCAFRAKIWTSHGWQNDRPDARPFAFDVEVKDALNGNVLDVFTCVKHFCCAGDGLFCVEHPLDPIYELVGASRVRSRGTSRWRRC